MDDKIRTPLTAVAKMIMSEKDEPYLEIYLYDNDYNKKWYDSSLVLRYTRYTAEIHNSKVMCIYEYEKAYLKQSKTVTELKEYRNHNSCPACSSMMCSTKFIPSNEPDKMSQLICTCERCQYKWWSKPDYLK